MARTTPLFILLFVLINVDSKKLRGNDKNTLKQRILKPLNQINNEITTDKENRRLKDPKDKELKDKATKDGPKEGPKEGPKDVPKGPPKEPPKDKEPKSKQKKSDAPKAPKATNPPKPYIPPQSIPILETLPPTSPPVALPVAVPVSLPISSPLTVNPTPVPTSVPTLGATTLDEDSVKIPGLSLPYNETILSYSCPISSKNRTSDTKTDESNVTNVFEDVKIAKAYTVNSSISELDNSNTTAMETNATNMTTVKEIEGKINYGYKLESITEISNDTEILLKQYMFNSIGGHVCPSRRLIVDIDDNYQITEVDYQSHFHRRLEVLELTTTARDVKFKECTPELNINNTCTKYKGAVEVMINDQGSYSSIAELRESLIDYLEYFASNTNFTIIDENLIGMTITVDSVSKEPQSGNAATKEDVSSSSGGIIGMIVGIVALAGILFGLLYMKKEKKTRASAPAEGEVIQADSNRKKGDKDVKEDYDELELKKNGSTASAPPQETEDVPWAVATPVRECQTMR